MSYLESLQIYHLRSSPGGADKNIEKKYQTINKEIQEKDSIIKQLRQELSMKTNARNIIRNDLK